MALSSISVGPSLYPLILHFNHSIGLASLISQVGSYASNCNHFDQFVLFSIRAQKHSWTIQSERVCGFEMVQAPPIGVCVCFCVSHLSAAQAGCPPAPGKARWSLLRHHRDHRPSAAAGEHLQMWAMTETAVPQGDPLEAGRGLWSEVCRDGTQATQPLRYTA